MSTDEAVEAQLVHTARQMFETRLAKYNDPHNLEWDMGDMTDKWERHAFSAFIDLLAAEAEVDALRGENERLSKDLDETIYTLQAVQKNHSWLAAHPCRGLGGACRLCCGA